jgi:DNA-binding transcriptional regulator YdaS (Cro superfamily)
MLIRSAGQALDILGGNSKVARWLGVKPNTVASWREPDRGISRAFGIHFYAVLVIDLGHELAPQVFGLVSWNEISIPGLRNVRARAA